MSNRFASRASVVSLPICAVLLMGALHAAVRESGDDLEDVIEAARELDPLSSLLIWHRDSLLVEEYFNGMTADRTANVKSVSKSIVGLLVGIAIEDGAIDSLDQPIADLLPAYANVLNDRHRTTRH